MKSNTNINGFVHRLKSRLAQVHEQLKTIDERRLNEPLAPRTVYQLLGDWLFEILVYGFLITFVLNAWLGWLGLRNIALVPANGIALWFIGELIGKVKDSIKKN